MFVLIVSLALLSLLWLPRTGSISVLYYQLINNPSYSTHTRSVADPDDF